MSHSRIAIIGSGFGGLGAAVRLKQEGIEDFIILERAQDVGGAWRDNTYPGCVCDVQSHLYSFSFAMNPDWSRSFSPQPEIWAYLQRCAERFGVLPHIKFDHAVREAAWDEGARQWNIETSAGAFTAHILVMATGGLSDPVIPVLPGIEHFEGRHFHSAQWDQGFDLAGKRVAVIGTGSSAIQFVPRIQPGVKALHIFQRTAPWVMPQHDGAHGAQARALYRRFPFAQRAVRGLIYAAREAMVLLFRNPALMRIAQRRALSHLAGAVADPALRAKLTPDFTMGCKRVLVSNDYFPAVTQPNVEMVTDGVSEVRARSIVGRDGRERPVDVIVYATGFRVTDPPLAAHVRGRDGLSLAQAWRGSPKAYLGTAVAGFPNLFMLLGPNTGLGHSSVVYMIEVHLEHLVRALRYMTANDVSIVEATAEAQAAFVEEVDERMQGTVWTSGGCASWYLDSTGRNSTLWPDFTWRFRQRAAPFDPRAYALS